MFRRRGCGCSFGRGGGSRVGALLIVQLRWQGLRSILLTVAWRLAETVRHAIRKFASHIVVVLVVEHVADVEDHCLIAEVFPPV
jgi:hypothetical protein